MIQNICLFEDHEYVNLEPLVLLRPVFELRTGIHTIKKRIIAHYPQKKTHLLCRKHLEESVKSKSPKYIVNDLSGINDTCLFINGSALLTEKIKEPATDEMGISNGRIAYIFLSKEKIKLVQRESFVDPGLLKKLKKEIKTVEVNIKMVTYPWDIVNNAGEMIKADFKQKMSVNSVSGGRVDKGVIIYGPKSNFFIEKGAVVEAGTVIHADSGPVYIDLDAKVRAHSIIDGPAYIGERTVIDAAKISPNTAIGHTCRRGGEVEETIIQAFSNKHHEGFLGHSYLGEWVNIGAMATNSDLKNNYGTIRIYVRGVMKDCGTIKMGCFIGDHTKIGIGVLINTGSVIGVGCNIYGGGIIPSKYVPSFLWGSNSGVFNEYQKEKFINDIKSVMIRRKKAPSAGDIQLIEDVFKITDNARKEFMSMFSNR